jgi:hypothetical protein
MSTRKDRSLQHLVHFVASQVGATEAAAFRLPELALAFHIRPDEAGVEQRAAAIAAFRELVRPCVDSGKDGVFEIEGICEQQPSVLTYAGYRPQYCLIWLPTGHILQNAVVAIVTRCSDQQEAIGLLQRLRICL